MRHKNAPGILCYYKLHHWLASTSIVTATLTSILHPLKHTAKQAGEILHKHAAAYRVNIKHTKTYQRVKVPTLYDNKICLELLYFSGNLSWTQSCNNTQHRQYITQYNNI